jgi:hypothetical protein
VLERYWAVFWQLAGQPFHSPRCVWGIVPLYFAWFLNELSSGKANFRTAIQTGFTLMWASAQWLYHPGTAGSELASLRAVNGAVTLVVMGLGLLALVSGLRRKFPRYCSFLGHTRFSGYFMIMMFPIQAGLLSWSWDRLAAIFLFAIPIWGLVFIAFLPLRK